jgi:hypothetical protein
MGLMVGPAFAHEIFNSAAAGDDPRQRHLHEGGAGRGRRARRNDLIRGGQGDDDFLTGDDGSDVVRAQQDDDEVCGNDQNDKLYGGQGDDNLGGGDVTSSYRGWNGDASGDENGNDFLKSRDHVSGNDYVDGNFDTDTCVIDAGDIVDDCELWLARRERPGSLREGGCY